MRIAWVTYDFEEYSALHVNALAADHDVMLVMPQPDADEPTYEVDERVRHLAFEKPRLRQPLRQIKSVREILQAIHRFRPDVVHFQQGHLWFNGVLAGLRRRYPLVITVHDPRHHAGDKVSKKTPQWVMDYGFRQADHVIVHGEALVSDVQRLFGFERSHVHVIPHVAMGCDGDTSVGSATDDGRTVLFFGRIYAYKGLEYFIHAQPIVNATVPDARFVIGGRGDDIEQYRRRMVDVERFEVHDRWISDEERADMFRRASVVVLPYVEATQSGVVPVAYNYGKPVIATRVGALAECVDDGETGLLIPPRDVEALAGAIVRVLEDDELRAAMGRAARRKLEQELAPEVVAAQTANVYEATIRGRAGARGEAAGQTPGRREEALV